ncbi:malate dehydrogenase, mitochondrial-like [Anticarsia gemmatalis]|uniref:malate dehydrogenase, mitochondrial-like n=1 Tax=Anticarsia gemmatalis TaxID=129554 RepID=UPI003F76720A
MLGRKVIKNLLSYTLKSCVCTNYSPQRNIQVSLVGTTNDVGSNLAILLKQSNKFDQLNLYDDDCKVKGIGMELNHIPGGPEVRTWAGDSSLQNSIRNSDLVVMVYRVPRKPGYTREQMLSANAPAVQKLCRAIANENPNAFLAIATNPLNSVVPFASALMYKYGCYNPFKMFGITHIDTARARMLTARALQINPLDLTVPVIGGHSDDTIIPLFSNMAPCATVVDPYKADTLTRLVRKAGTEVVFQKHGKECATLAMAWAINEFINLMIDAIRGQEVIVNCFTANPNFGTRFFSGATKVGPYGITQACHSFQLSDFESFLLNTAVPLINRDVGLGEEYVKYIEMMEKY